MNILIHIINSSFCFYQKKFNQEWSEQLNEIIDKHESAKVTEHTVVFTVKNTDIEVWVKNKFYSYGYAWYINGKVVDEACRFRPELKVINKLYKLEKTLRKESNVKEVKSFNERIDKLIGKDD